MRLSKAALAGHTCGDCWHGATDELPLARLPYLRCLRYPRYEGAVPTDAIHQPGDPACSRWKAEKADSVVAAVLNCIREGRVIALHAREENA